MIHTKRAFQVRRIDDLDELARALTEQSWTLCTAFAHADLILANDAFSEDGAQEFAVIRAGHQVESLTASWMTTERMRAIIADLVKGGGVDMGAVTLRTDHPASPDHCRYCA
jgi:hypothetical protein